MDTTAVILAVATPPGRSLRGIVRASGPSCFAVLEPHVLCDDRSRGLRPARLLAGGLDLACLALFAPGPRSYTGEDSVELQVPGNPALLERVIDAVLATGRLHGIAARRAEPGEYTARAYLNGRMTLAEAEGVAAVIAARSDAQLRAAGVLSSGRLAALARELVESLAGALALVEAGIDFTDQEDVVAIAPADLSAIAASAVERLDAVLARSIGSEQLDAIPWVVLAGPVNAGKSTLFNMLLGRRRAVVSGVAGTTRDVLAEPLAIDTPHGPAEVMLADLAGAEHAATGLQRDMQDAARRAVERADLVIRCSEPARGDREIAVEVRRLDVRGIETLRGLIAERLAGRAVSLAADTLALLPRHEAALRSARASLAEALAVIEQPELAAACLRLALDDLATLTGEVTPDDILGRIFATFCVGK